MCYINSDISQLNRLLMRFAAAPLRNSSPANAKAAVGESAPLLDIIISLLVITKTENCFIRRQKKPRINARSRLYLSLRRLALQNLSQSRTTYH